MPVTASALTARLGLAAAILLALLCASCTTPAPSRALRDVVYVNNVLGSDDFDGRYAEPGPHGRGPYRHIMHAVRECQPGALISIADTGENYRETVSIEGYHKGLPDLPLVLDGNGACVTGLVTVPTDQWQLYRDDIYYFANRLGDADYQPKAWYERKIGDGVYGIMPNSNWLGFTKHQGWFNEPGAPEIFFLNGKPGPNVVSLDDIPPGGFFYDSMAKILPSLAGQRILFFRLPAGAAIADCTVELPLNRGIYVSDDFVTVRNIGSIYSQDDGFAGFWGQSYVLQNIYAAYCCDQGVSFHGNSTTFIDGAVIERNAGCGIVDVMSCTTIYRNITVRDNYPVGALLQGFAHGVYGGHFYANQGNQIEIGKGASASLIQCLIEGRTRMEYGRLSHCTLVGEGTGLTVTVGAQIGDSILANTPSPLRIEQGALRNTRLQRTILSLGDLTLSGKTVAPDAWTDAQETCPGLKGAILDTPALAAPDYQLPADSPHLKAASGNTAPGARPNPGAPAVLLEWAEALVDRPTPPSTR